MHPRGTTKAPASPHTTRAGGAERDGHLGRVKAMRGAAAEPNLMAVVDALAFFTNI